MHPIVYDRICAESDVKRNEKVCTRDKLSDTNIDDALLNLIIKERLPLSKLNSIHLQKLIQGTHLTVTF